MSYYPQAIEIVVDDGVNHKAVLAKVAMLSPKEVVKAFELMQPRARYTDDRVTQGQARRMPEYSTE